MSVADIFRTMEYGPAPEARGPGLDWIESHGHRFGLFIGGRWQPPASGEYFDVINPATGAFLASVAQAGEDDVAAAVAEDGTRERVGVVRPDGL